jgi:hypothetical protein
MQIFALDEDQSGEGQFFSGYVAGRLQTVANKGFIISRKE